MMGLCVEGFGSGEIISLTFDPDTYENLSFGATVADMAGSTIGLVFDDGSKGVGVFHPIPSGATVAEVGQALP